jgi:hypothetical protein
MVCSSLGLDSDDADSWVVLATIMCAITKVAKPGFQSRGVVFLDSDAVGDDAGFAGDGSLLAGAVEECDVDSVVNDDVNAEVEIPIGREVS